MPCQKCQGFLITEQVPADTIVLTVDKCLNCGARREHGHVPIPYERTVGHVACINCGKTPAPGYSQCDSCREKQRARRKVKPRHNGQLARRGVEVSL